MTVSMKGSSVSNNWLIIGAGSNAVGRSPTKFTGSRLTLRLLAPVRSIARRMLAGELRVVVTWVSRTMLMPKSDAALRISFRLSTSRSSVSGL